MKIPTFKPIPLTYAIHIVASACLMWTISEQILDFHRHGLQSNTSKVLPIALLIALSFLTKIWLSSNLKRKRKEAAWSAVWTKIKAESNLAKAVSMLIFALTQPMVVLILCVATTSLILNSARCLAMTLASTGNYEASERLYKFSNPRSQTSLISDWDYPYRHNRGDQLVNIEPKVSAVASVYGNNSSELADYYAFLAEASLQKALYLKEEEKQQRTLLFEASQLLSEKGFQIYSSHGNNTKCSAAIVVVAFAQISLGKISEARHSVNKAVDLLAKSEPSARKYWVEANLASVAWNIGDYNLARQIQVAAASCPIRVNEHRKKGFCDATSVVIAMLQIALVFLLETSERSILTLIFRTKWILELKLAPADLNILGPLDKLVALELYQGRTMEAEIYSQAMLQIALADA